MLAETIAKGGHLLLNVGPEADGSIPEMQARALRDAGAWVHAHAEVVFDSQPFEHSGRRNHMAHAAGVSPRPGVTRLNVVDTANRPARRRGSRRRIGGRGAPRRRRASLVVDPR